MEMGARSADVSHRQSVAFEEPGDKLSGVTAVTHRPLETA
jgi:hypothetical protein